MQILLASAKIMNSTTSVQVPFTHEPHFGKEVGRMALELGEMSVDVLSKELHCNEKIALENKLRYSGLLQSGGASSGSPSLLWTGL